jgi:hypothetical protein
MPEMGAAYLFRPIRGRGWPADLLWGRSLPVFFGIDFTVTSRRLITAAGAVMSLRALGPFARSHQMKKFCSLLSDTAAVTLSLRRAVPFVSLWMTARFVITGLRGMDD